MDKDKHLGLFIEPELHKKLKYVAKYNGRSISGHVMFLIQESVRNFEKEHGKIESEDKE